MSSPPRRIGRRRLTVLAVLAALVIVGMGGAWQALSHRVDEPRTGNVAASWTRRVVTGASLESIAGVRVTQVAVTGGDGLVDLRFQVLDPAKAASVHEPQNPPALVDEATDVVVSSLLMGHSHTGAFRQGATYYLVFNNPGNLVKRGGTVTVLLGGTQLEHVVVK